MIRFETKDNIPRYIITNHTHNRCFLAYAIWEKQFASSKFLTTKQWINFFIWKLIRSYFLPNCDQSRIPEQFVNENWDVSLVSGRGVLYAINTVNIAISNEWKYIFIYHFTLSDWSMKSTLPILSLANSCIWFHYRIISV